MTKPLPYTGYVCGAAFCDDPACDIHSPRDEEESEESKFMSIQDIGNFMPFMEESAGQAEFVLELGVGEGDGSTTAIVKGLEAHGGPNLLFISVDILPDGMRVCPQAPYWHFVVGDSLEQSTVDRVKEICGERRPDLIFIDTVHNYEHMQRELEIWGPLAKDSTTWLFHDTWMFGICNHMWVAIDEWAHAHGWVYEDYSREGHGMGRMRKGAGA